ncbi:hypothetical protein HID58_090987, partial [Brassica napus]
MGISFLLEMERLVRFLLFNKGPLFPSEKFLVLLIFLITTVSPRNRKNYTLNKMMDTPSLGVCFVTLFMFLFHYVPCALGNQAFLSCDSVLSVETSPQHSPSGERIVSFYKTSINISNIFFNILHIDNTFKTIKLVRQDYSVSFCSTLSFTKTMFPPKIFQLFPNYKNLIVFSNCDPRFHYLENFTCSNGGLVQCITMNITTSCRTISNVIVPAGFIPEKEAWNLENVLRGGFEVKLDINERPCKQCLKTGGLQFRQVCKSVLLQRRLFFYPNRIKEFSGSLLGFKCIKTSSGELPKSSAGADPTSFNYLLTGSRDRSIRTSKNREFEELIPLKRYSYAEVKEITNLFAQEIGRGGYGIVYEGNLCEGLKVAVKVLKESKKNVEDFINEVASMSRTSYIHIVSLLGFCYEGSKRAIIYEFVENGSLDKYLEDQITRDEDEEFARKMILLDCPCPSDRPSMNRVVEMMEGSLSALEAPPKYLLHLSASPMPPSAPEDKIQSPPRKAHEKFITI